jgi:hypothetical protein
MDLDAPINSLDMGVYLRACSENALSEIQPAAKKYSSFRHAMIYNIDVGTVVPYKVCVA